MGIRILFLELKLGGLWSTPCLRVQEDGSDPLYNWLQGQNIIELPPSKGLESVFQDTTGTGAGWNKIIKRELYQRDKTWSLNVYGKKPAGQKKGATRCFAFVITWWWAYLMLDSSFLKEKYMLPISLLNKDHYINSRKTFASLLALMKSGAISPVVNRVMPNLLAAWISGCLINLSSVQPVSVGTCTSYFRLAPKGLTKIDPNIFTFYLQIHMAGPSHYCK